MLGIYGIVAAILLGSVGALTVEDASIIRVGLFALLGALMAVLPGLALERMHTKPIRELTDAARRILGGDYSHRVYAAPSGEIGHLARTFNTMSERLGEQFAQVDSDRQQLRTILNGMIEGVVAIDHRQHVMYANGKACELLEFHPKTYIGHKFWELVRHKPMLALVERAVQQQQLLRSSFDWKGNSKSMDLIASPLGAERGAILVLYDTTELRRLERLRSEFVANVSHELKTPLAVIKANVETLLDGAIDDLEVRMSFLDQINEQTERLHNLILDLMALARIESGNQVLDIQRVALAQCVGECVDRHRTRAEARHQTIEVIPAAEPSSAEIWTDYEALSQILDNLVDNALKYTPEGSRIRIRWYGYGDQVCLEVEDNGPGIPETDLPRIFERFYRVDKARSRELGGTGLGLAIVKNLANLMKGNATASSQLGQGARFTVCLPRTVS